MEEKVEKTIEALKKHKFNAVYAGDRREAKEKIMELVPKGAAVAVPGSASVRATGAVEALKERGCEVFDHWSDPSPLVRKKQLTADAILLSANALAMTGQIVNMDGIGNRVAPSIFGPGRVIFVVGKNKITADLESARERIHKIAAPRRALELKLKVPCAETGQCTDCNSPLRICRAEVILHRPPSLTQTTVIVVDEELGN